MSDAHVEHDDGARGGWRQRLGGIAGAALNFWVVRRIRAVMDSANAAGAGLFAPALAFTTMFAIIPVLLLLSGVLGWVIEDPVVRSDLLNQLIALVPPLAEAMAESLSGAIRERGALSIVGLVGLLWGASNFYDALDEVMRRLFPGGPVRGFLERRVRGILAVLILVTLVVGTVLLSGIWGWVATVAEQVGVLFLLRLTVPLAMMAAMIVVVLIVYRFVPTAPPSTRAALLPAIVVGIGIGLLTTLFTVIAPLLIGGLSAFGVLAALFGAFVWLNFCFQILLYGAAWARYRRDRLRLQGRPASG